MTTSSRLLLVASLLLFSALDVRAQDKQTLEILERAEERRSSYALLAAVDDLAACGAELSAYEAYSEEAFRMYSIVSPTGARNTYDEPRQVWLRKRLGEIDRAVEYVELSRQAWSLHSVQTLDDDAKRKIYDLYWAAVHSLDVVASSMAKWPQEASVYNLTQPLAIMDYVHPQQHAHCVPGRPPLDLPNSTYHYLIDNWAFDRSMALLPSPMLQSPQTAPEEMREWWYECRSRCPKAIGKLRAGLIQLMEELTR